MTTSQEHQSLKEKQRKERELLILQVAAETFLEKGYHETSIDEIAARVGIAKGTVYLHFASKEDLIATVFIQDIQMVQEKLDDIFSTETQATHKLSMIIDLIYSNYIAKWDKLLYMISHDANIRKIFTEHKELHELHARITSQLSAVLDQGKREGEIDSGLPTEAIEVAFLCLLSPLNYEHMIRNAEISIEEAVNYSKRLLMTGICTRS